MPAKKVSIKPKANTPPATLDDWVTTAKVEQPPEIAPELEPEPVKMKRLTLDIPEDVHRAIKKRAADEGVAMVDLLREDLAQKYRNL
jgi:predicted DNA binding CopG/RHH family protein